MTQAKTQRGTRAAARSSPSAGGWTADVVTTREQLQAYAGEWNDLLARSRANTIFLTWEWVSAWLDAVYPDAPLMVVAVRDGDGRLAAVAPFYRSHLRLLGLLRYRCLRVIGDCHCGAEYMDIIVREGCEEAATASIVESLLRHADPWDCIYVPNVAGWTGGLGRLAAGLGGALAYVHTRPRSFAAVELPDTHEEYLRTLSRRHRSNVKRQEKRLSADHDVKFLRCQSEQELPRFLEAFFALHQRRWQSAGQEGSFVRKPPMERFYRRFSREALRRGWLRVVALEVDGAFQATQYGYAYGGTFYSMQEGYHPESMKGIGNILRVRAIQSCIEEGLKLYDFLGEYTDHKRHWEARPRWGGDVFIGRGSLRNRLLFWKEIWPVGRYIQEGRPANEGRFYD